MLGGLPARDHQTLLPPSRRPASPLRPRRAPLLLGPGPGAIVSHLRHLAHTVKVAQLGVSGTSSCSPFSGKKKKQRGLSSFPASRGWARSRAGLQGELGQGRGRGGGGQESSPGLLQLVTRIPTLGCSATAPGSFRGPRTPQLAGQHSSGAESARIVQQGSAGRTRTPQKPPHAPSRSPLAPEGKPRLSFQQHGSVLPGLDMQT